MPTINQPGIYKKVSWQAYRAIPAMNQSLLKHGYRSMRRLKRAIDGEVKPARAVVAPGNAAHAILAGEYTERFWILPNFELDAENKTKGEREIKTRPKVYKKQNGDLSAHGLKWQALCREHNKPDDYEGEIDTGRITGQRRTDSKNTEYYKTKVAEFLANAEANGRDIITADELETAKRIVDRITNRPEHKHIAELIKKSELEVTAVAEINGTLCKTRIDGLAGYHAWDLKTTYDIEKRSFYRTFKAMSYGAQFCFQKLILAELGLQIQSYDVIAAESRDDYDVALVPIPFQVIDNAEQLIYQTLEAYEHAKKRDYWPGLANGQPYPLDVPLWDQTTDDAVDWSDIEPGEETPAGPTQGNAVAF